MANLIGLNTAQLPALSQVVIAYDDGNTFDYLVQKSGSNVTVTDARKKAYIKSFTQGGFPLLVET